MYRRNSSSIGEAIGGWLMFFGIAYGISDGFHINYLLALLILAGLSLGITFTAFGVSSLLKWKEKRKPCTHGVKAGGTGTCEACRIANEQRQEESLLSKLAEDSARRC